MEILKLAGRDREDSFASLVAEGVVEVYFVGCVLIAVAVVCILDRLVEKWARRSSF